MVKKKTETQPSVRIPYSVRMYDKDPSYWGMPLIERVYLRVLYAAVLFLVVASAFDACFHAPLWMQLLLGGSVAAATLVFRVAYPKGFSSIWEWTMEGMAEAAEEMEAKGKTPKISSKELKKQLEEQKELDAKRRRKE